MQPYQKVQFEGGALKKYQYTVFFEPQEGGFNIIVPAIPEICTFGETMEEARAMAEDAIRCYLESAIKNGEACLQRSSMPSEGP